MKKIIVFAATLAAMTACNKSVLETATPSEGFGYINLGISTDTEMVVTKAATAMTDEQLASYNVTLKQGETVKWTKEYKDISAENWIVPAGTYTIEVENLTKTEAYANDEHNTNPYGQVRVYGTVNVTVTAGQTATPTVTCSPVNSKISFISDASFNKIFSNASVNVKDAETNPARTVELGTLTSSFDTAKSAYFEQGTVYYDLSATVKVSSEAKTFKRSIALTQAKWKQVTFKTTNDDGKITLTITVDGNITDPEQIDVTIDPTSSESGE